MMALYIDLNPQPYQKVYFHQYGERIHLISWTPPPSDAWKLNFASITTYGMVGGGFVLRDQFAFFKSAFASAFERMNQAVEVELNTLQLGLSDALENGTDYLEVEGHSAETIQLITSQVAPTSPFVKFLVGKCIILLSSFKWVKIHPVSEFANEGALMLSRMALNHIGPRYWDGKPLLDISQILMEDVVGRWVDRRSNDDEVIEVDD